MEFKKSRKNTFAAWFRSQVFSTTITPSVIKAAMSPGNLKSLWTDVSEKKRKDKEEAMTLDKVQRDSTTNVPLFTTEF